MRRRGRRNPSSSFDESITSTAGVLHTHEDPHSSTAKKYVYSWEHKATGKTGRSAVWVFAGDFGKLIDNWNARKPKEWHFDFAGLSRNPTWASQSGADHEAFLQHLNRAASRQLVREVIMPKRRRVRKTKRNPESLDEHAKRIAARLKTELGPYPARDHARAREALARTSDDIRLWSKVRDFLYDTRYWEKNPPRDPEYKGAFTLGHEPKRTGDFVDGDTCAVQTPHARHPHLDRDYEVWVFGMIDPRLGNHWNYCSGPMSKSDAIVEAKRLARL
jgi:hypothetical protein